MVILEIDAFQRIEYTSQLIVDIYKIYTSHKKQRFETFIMSYLLISLMVCDIVRDKNQFHCVAGKSSFRLYLMKIMCSQ